MNKNEICGAVMAALFVSGDAVEIRAFAELFGMDPDELDILLQEIIEEKRTAGRAYCSFVWETRYSFAQIPNMRIISKRCLSRMSTLPFQNPCWKR